MCSTIATCHPSHRTAPDQEQLRLHADALRCRLPLFPEIYRPARGVSVHLFRSMGVPGAVTGFPVSNSRSITSGNRAPLLFLRLMKTADVLQQQRAGKSRRVQGEANQPWSEQAVLYWTALDKWRIANPVYDLNGYPRGAASKAVGRISPVRERWRRWEIVRCHRVEGLPKLRPAGRTRRASRSGWLSVVRPSPFVASRKSAATATDRLLTRLAEGSMTAKSSWSSGPRIATRAGAPSARASPARGFARLHRRAAHCR